MDLDMYAFTTTAKIPAVDFRDPEDTAEVFDWREHPNLHGWMEQLYRRKGGRREFNVATVHVDLDDLNALETAVRRDELPHTEGFFFGTSRPEEKMLDIQFIEKARKAIADGKYVFYSQETNISTIADHRLLPGGQTAACITVEALQM